MPVTRRPFLRFSGKLWASGEFEPAIGWETTRIAHRPQGDPDHSLRLLDADGAVLAEAAVEVREPACRTRGDAGATAARLVGYLPLHEEGRAVELRRGALVLHRTELSERPPSLEILETVVVDDQSVLVRWDADHDRALTFNVVFVDALRRAIPVARDLTERELRLDVTDLPGGTGCQLAVLATDGSRSTSARGERFDLPDRPPRIAIVTPADGDELAPDQPLSLLGHAHDLAGRALPDDQLVWSVDGEATSRGRLALAGPLAPGEHRIRLGYEAGGALAAEAEIGIVVAQRSPAQEEWLRVCASLGIATADAGPP